MSLKDSRNYDLLTGKIRDYSSLASDWDTSKRVVYNHATRERDNPNFNLHYVLSGGPVLALPPNAIIPAIYLPEILSGWFSVKEKNDTERERLARHMIQIAASDPDKLNNYILKELGETIDRHNKEEARQKRKLPR